MQYLFTSILLTKSLMHKKRSVIKDLLNIKKDTTSCTKKTWFTKPTGQPLDTSKGFIITWILHQIITYSNKVKLIAG